MLADVTDLSSESDSQSRSLPLYDVLGSYLASSRAAAESSLTALNTSINWMLTLSLALAAVVGNSLFGASKGSGSESFALLLLLGSFPVLVHFAVRVTKSYINILRFSTVERGILRFLTGGEADIRKIQAVSEEYHSAWKSPIPGKVMIRKLFMEFGFFYPGAGLLVAICYLLPRVWDDRWNLVLGASAASLIGAGLEIWSFRRSAYGREISVDEIAKRLA